MNKFKSTISSIFYNEAYLIRKELYKSITNESKSFHGVVLDFGCGQKPYEHLIDCQKYIGVDFETEREKGEKTKTDFTYDGEKIPFPDNYFDCVISTEVFEHLFNLNDILKEIHRVLKPNGKLLATCPFSFGEHEKPYDYARYTRFALTHLLTKHKFENINIEKTGNLFSVIIQYSALYINYIVKKIPILGPVLFVLFVSPLFLFSNIINFLLPKKILRNDVYFNNIITCTKWA